MPSSLVESTRRPSGEVSKETRNEVRRASQNQSDGAVKAEGADNSGEEVVERTSRKMHVLDKAEEPQARVADSLEESSSGSLTLLQANSIAQHSIVCKLSFFFGQPSSRQGTVSQGEDSDDADYKGQDTFNDEEPLPALKSVVSIDGAESGCRNQAGEGRRKDVA